MIDAKITEQSDGQLRIEVVRFKYNTDGSFTEESRKVVAEQDADGVWHDADAEADIEAHEDNERYLPDDAFGAQS